MQGLDVLVNSDGFAGKVIVHPIAKSVHAAHEFVFLVADNKTVIDIRHRLPLQLAVGDLVKGFSYDGGFVLDLADIMETDIPLVARPVKDVGVAAGNIMAFQDQHFFTGIPGEQSRGSETTDPGADDNGIPGLVKG